MAGSAPTRIAVVQIAFHPAAIAAGRSMMADPQFDFKATTSSLSTEGAPLTQDVQLKLEVLGESVEGEYKAQLLKKITTILSSCVKWGVRLVIFPEYSIPCDLLPKIACHAPGLVIVAGTHTVDRMAIESGVYEALSLDDAAMPHLGEAVCPVLFQKHLHALQPKLHASPLERDSLICGNRWAPVVLPKEAGIPGPIGVLICLDFLACQSKKHILSVSSQLDECALLAVPSLTPSHTTEVFSSKSREESRRYKRVVAYANIAKHGGSTLYIDHKSHGLPFPEGVGTLGPGDEGVIVADIDLSPTQRGHSSSYVETAHVTPFACAPLIHAAIRAEESQARLSREFSTRVSDLHDRDDGALFELLDDISKSQQKLSKTGATSRDFQGRPRDPLYFSRIKRASSSKKLAPLIRDVVLPTDVLPFQNLRQVMSGGCFDALRLWAQAGQKDAASLFSLADKQRTAAKALPPSGFWVERGTEILKEVRQSISCPADVCHRLHHTDRLTEQAFLLHSNVHIRIHNSVSELFPGFQRSKDLEQNTSYGYGDTGNSIGMMEQWFHRTLERVDELCLWIQVKYDTAVTRIISVSDPSASKGNAEVFVATQGEQGHWIAWRVPDEQRVCEEVLRVASSILQLPLSDAIVADLDGFRDTLNENTAKLRSGQILKLEARRAERLAFAKGHYQPLRIFVDGLAKPAPAFEALNKWAIALSCTPALLLGEFGAGKSLLLIMWSLERWRSSESGLPVLVPLSESAGASDPIRLILKTLGLDWSHAGRATLQLLFRRKLVIPIFDGIDEFVTKINKDTLRTYLQAFAGCSHPYSKVLVSARDHTFASEGELSDALPQATRLSLARLSANQVSNVVKAYSDGAQEAARYQHLIDSTYDLADLVSRPLLLTMILPSLGEFDPPMNVGVSDVYDAYVFRWLEQSHIGDQEGISDEDKMAIAETLADTLWRSGEGDCTSQELRQKVLGTLGETLTRDDCIDSISAFYEIQTGAFFVREGDNFRFAHRSFLEYFLARYVLRVLAVRPGECLATRRFSPEVLTFIGQILRRRFKDPFQSRPVNSLRAWLTHEHRDNDERSGHAIGPRENAVILLHRLSEEDAECRQWIPPGARLAGIDLAGANLGSAALSKVKLSGADLRDANLEYAILEGADLRFSRLSGARLNHADLSGVDLSDADLYGAQLDNVCLRDAIAHRAKFVFSEADRVDLTGASMEGAILRSSTWTNCAWPDEDRLPSDVADALAIPPMQALGDTETLRDLSLCVVSHISSDEYDAFPKAQLSWSPSGQFIVATTYRGLAGYGFENSIFSLTPTSRSLGVKDITTPLPVLSSLDPAEDYRSWPEHIREPYHQDRYAWSHSGQFVAWSTTDNNIVICEPATRKIFLTWQPEWAAEHPIAFSWERDESSLTILTRNFITRHSLQSPRESSGGDVSDLRLRSGHALFFERGGRLLLAASQFEGEPSGVAFFEVSDDRESLRPLGSLGVKSRHWDIKAIVDISPDGALASVATGESIEFVDLRRGQGRMPLVDGRLESVMCLAWSPKGNQLAVSSSATWILCLEPLSWRRCSEQGSIALEWSPDGAMLATAFSDGSITLYESNQCLPRLVLHHNEEVALVTTPEGFFSASSPESRDIVVNIGDALVAPLGKLRQLLHRPDLVEAALQGSQLSGLVARMFADQGWSASSGTDTEGS